MRVWISTVGSSPLAVFNTLWMAIVKEGYIPDKVYLLWNYKVEKNKEIIKNYIKSLNESYNFNIDVDESYKVSEDDFKDFSNALKEIIVKEKKRGNEVAIDMTPGRKFMSALSMFAGIEGVSDGKNKYKCDKVYYLHLKDMGYINYPLFLIPFSIQELHEFISELSDGKEDNKVLKKEELEDLAISRKEILAIINQYFLFGKSNFEIKVENQKFAAISLYENDNKAKVEINKDLKLSYYVGDCESIETILNASGLKEIKFIVYDDEKEEFNEEEFYKWLFKKLKEKETYYITFDTNALINQIPRKIIDYLDKQREKISPNFVISQCVINELTNERGKIKDCEDRDFINQPSSIDRIFKLGLSQIRLLNNRNAIIIPGKGVWDNNIKESFIKFSDEHKGKLLILTSDKNFTHNLQYLPDIIPIYIEFGELKKLVKWENVRDLIYISSIVFGKIHVKPISQVLGIWRGKNPIDWDEEKILFRKINVMCKHAIDVLRNIH
ncbi:hypothetical protein J422_05254 [Methanocaldococcus villosus KIN24-T80]|uniref:Uncharacterized protein n=1 Tax=Methanocaldococcus villosus KIN24-T80 TaxID=1069083 RepID=N6VRX3_9EURY|nr:hypothetical protein [Methanocaldococcus villosus]ENN95911.1 hypothetical protein J422_05254 [Methanocaldococcus villosus KIN24-T80]